MLFSYDAAVKPKDDDKLRAISRATFTLVEQTGKTDSNRPQQQLHIEAAIRAVRAAAPFDLPEEYYDNWKFIKAFRFDRRL